MGGSAEGGREELLEFCRARVCAAASWVRNSAISACSALIWLCKVATCSSRNVMYAWTAGSRVARSSSGSVGVSITGTFYLQAPSL